VLRSLRFRLTAFFLAGVVVAGLVAAAIAFRLLDGYIRDRARATLDGEAVGVSRLVTDQTTYFNFGGRLPVKKLERATGDLFFFVPAQPGLELFPKQQPKLRPLPRRLVPIDRLRHGETAFLEFTPPGFHRTYLAVAKPLAVGRDRSVLGALVVARPKDQLGTRVLPLLGRLALALLGGVLVAALLALYLTRRITRPVLDLSSVADEVAEGRYDVEVPDVPGGGEIRHLADRLREMTARLAEADERERSFLMSVSHELRTPLTAIRGHVEALREGVAEDAASRAASLEVVAEETERLERLVGDVLDLAKLDAHRFTLTREEVDMERLCERAYSAFGEEARRREIEYRREIRAHPVIEADGDRVLQIITNLLANAFRWTPDGGRIGLTLQAENGAVAVAVDDTGPGVPPDERERIFRAFWSRDGGGTGLGLAIARELAEAHGGRIELDSEPGRGSRFELVLPSEPERPSALA
jgi:signal transduction histidine kinase